MKIWAVTLFFLSTASRAETTESSSLVMKALEESKTTRVELASATDAQVTSNDMGILTLEDPGSDKVSRGYKWVIGLKFQNYKPQGVLESPDNYIVILDNMPAQNLPSLEMGAQFSGGDRWQWSALAHLGYASQNSIPSHQSFGEVSDARLNTALADVGLQGTYQMNSFWGLEGALGLGVISYTQTGSSALAQFSSETPFRFLNFGAHIRLPADWQIFANMSNRSPLNQNTTISAQKESFELGTRYLW